MDLAVPQRKEGGRRPRRAPGLQRLPRHFNVAAIVFPELSGLAGQRLGASAHKAQCSETATAGPHARSHVRTASWRVWLQHAGEEAVNRLELPTSSPSPRPQYASKLC